MSAIRAVCPRCSADADLAVTPACSACGWSASIEDGIIDLVTDADRGSPILASYFANYDRIAGDDLEAPILNLSYVQHQAANLARYAGPVDGLTILDLGCGQGFLTRLLQQRGARMVVAVDLSRAYLKRLTGHPGVMPMQANAERLPFRETFDLLVSTDVMEHVLNLGSFLVSVNQSLRPGGTVIIRVPYRENLIAYSRQAGCKYEFVHLRTFDRHTLTDAITGAGFVVEQTWLDGFHLYAPRPAAVSTVRGQVWYGRLQKWLLARLPDPTVVTTWPWRIAAMLLRPHEIVVKARKVKGALS